MKREQVFSILAILVVLIMILSLTFLTQRSVAPSYTATGNHQVVRPKYNGHGNQGHRIWIYTTTDKEETLQSVMLIKSYLDTFNKDMTLIVDEKDVVLKMDSESGLSVFVEGKKMPPPDVVLCRIESSVLLVDFHITVLRQLAMMGAVIVNNIEGIMKTTNKAWHLQELARAGIPIAPTLSYNHQDITEFDNVENTLKYPIVMKMVRGNGGNNVFMVSSQESQEELAGVLVNTYPYIYQTYIKESHGKDIRVIVVKDKAVFSMVRKSNTSSFRANLTQGGEGIIVTGKYPEAERLAVAIHKVLNLDVSGVDLLWSDKYGFLCCEVNNCPGFSKPIYVGQNIEQFIGNLLIEKVQQKQTS